MDAKQLSGVVFAQGWLGSQIESLQPADEKQTAIFGQMVDQWKTIDAALDELIRENSDALRRLEIIKQMVNA